MAKLRPPLIFLINWCCCHPRSVLFSERTPIIKELAWVEEVATGNIVKIQAHIGRDIRVDKAIYARKASNCINREYKWQELCDKLSLDYAFDLEPLSIRGGMGFMIHVQKRQLPDADMADSV